mgnify:CR=1 FL=1
MSWTQLRPQDAQKFLQQVASEDIWPYRNEEVRNGLTAPKAGPSMRGRGEPSHMPKGILIVDAYTTRYEHCNQETHTEDQGRQRAGPPEAGRRSAGDQEHNPGGKKLGMSQP